jgi:hypothetical protein
MSQSTITAPELAQLLQQYGIVGDWSDVPPPVPDPNWGDCEACGYHPCTERQAEVVGALYEALRAAGAPAPFTYYPHCWGEVFIEWAGAGPSRIIVCLQPGRITDVMVSAPPVAAYSFDLVGFGL